MDQHDFRTARQSEQAVSDRRAFLASDGAHVGACWKCFDNEANGKVSLRQRSNAALGQFLDQDAAKNGQATGSSCAPYLDVRFSNLCNFKCRSCWHGSSSSWFKDAQALGMTAGPRAQISSIRSVDQLLTLMDGDLRDVRHLYFAGGEPLMIVENYQLLERLVSEGRTDVELSFTTNGSHLGLGKRSMLDLWQQFETVTIELSVDATRQEAASLIRSGFSFEDFKNTVQSIRQHCPHAKINFGITVSALNLAELPRTLRDLRAQCGARASDFSIHPIQEPAHLRPSVLPKRAKARILRAFAAFIQEVGGDWSDDTGVNDLVAQLHSIEKSARAKASSDDLLALATSQRTLDALRGEDMRHSLPDVLGLVGYSTLTLWHRARKKLERLIAVGKRALP